MTAGPVALDLFAGSGWGVACQRLGIEEHGVEIMPEARATRQAAGMRSAGFDDVWDGLASPERVPEYEMLIASPPCQTFSAAGSGSGRRALDDVLGLIEERAHDAPTTWLKARAERLGLDDRTALVLTPLAYISRDLPMYVALEQVPSVLPVWEAYAEELFGWGYSVATGVMNAEQYGVPQTRKRAFLIAVLDGGLGSLELPKPTHSKYHNRDPKRLDPGVLPWVSMADALGFALTDGEAWIARDNSSNSGRGSRPVNAPSRTITSKADRTRVLRSNYGTSGDPANRGERAEDQPAPTITSKANRMKWMHERPATTIAGDSRVWPPGHKINAADIARLGDAEARERYGDRAGTNAARLTPEECAVLQTFPADFPFQGTKTKKHLQIGNAVPPLLAEAVLTELINHKAKDQS